MGKSQRTKGAASERELARLLSERLGSDVTRRLSQTRDGGHDLDGVPFALEVKRCETLALSKWWEQACIQADVAGKLPALAYRQSRKPWQFVIPMLFVAEVGTSWHCRYEYTMTLQLDGFCCVVREQLQQAQGEA